MNEHFDSYRALSSDGHTVRWVPWDLDEVHEQLSISWDNEAWTASATVGRENVQYVLRISPTWHVRQFLLFRDMDEPDLWLVSDGAARWSEMNGVRRPDLDGCVDIDLACTPFTNTLPIKRLALDVGASADIRVAYVDVDTLEVTPDRQRYTRTDTHSWRFEQLETGLSQDLEVDDYGLVVDYPSLFRRVD